MKAVPRSRVRPAPKKKSQMPLIAGVLGGSLVIILILILASGGKKQEATPLADAPARDVKSWTPDPVKNAPAAKKKDPVRELHVVDTPQELPTDGFTSTSS